MKHEGDSVTEGPYERKKIEPKGDSNISDPYSEVSTPILVEFTTEKDDKSVRQVGIVDYFRKPDWAKTKLDWVEKSEQAVDKSMTVIKDMSRRINTAMEKLDQKPNQVEIEFGIKFDGEVGVIIAKASIEATRHDNSASLGYS